MHTACLFNARVVTAWNKHRRKTNIYSKTSKMKAIRLSSNSRRQFTNANKASLHDKVMLYALVIVIQMVEMRMCVLVLPAVICMTQVAAHTLYVASSDVCVTKPSRSSVFIATWTSPQSDSVASHAVSAYSPRGFKGANDACFLNFINP